VSTHGLRRQPTSNCVTGPMTRTYGDTYTNRGFDRYGRPMATSVVLPGVLTATSANLPRPASVKTVPPSQESRFLGLPDRARELQIPVPRRPNLIPRLFGRDPSERPAASGVRGSGRRWGVPFGRVRRTEGRAALTTAHRWVCALPAARIRKRQPDGGVGRGTVTSAGQSRDHLSPVSRAASGSGTGTAEQ